MKGRTYTKKEKERLSACQTCRVCGGAGVVWRDETAWRKIRKRLKIMLLDIVADETARLDAWNLSVSPRSDEDQAALDKSLRTFLVTVKKLTGV